MAITHKRQDDLETLFSQFANLPKVSSDPKNKQNVTKTNAKKETK